MLEAHGVGGAVSPAEAEAAEIHLKYSGFIRRQASAASSICSFFGPASSS